MTDSAKTAEYADEVAPACVENLMAGHAARRWILEVRLDRRVGEVFLARFWKKDTVVMWVDWMGVARLLDGHQHVMLPDGSLDSPQRPIIPIHRHGREMDRMPAHHLIRLGVDLGRMIGGGRTYISISYFMLCYENSLLNLALIIM